MADVLYGGDGRPVTLGDIREVKHLIRQFFIDTGAFLMGLKEQVAELTGVVNSVRDKQDVQSTQLGDLQTSVDAEQEQVKAALDLLLQDNPDVAAAINTLRGVETNLGTASDTIGTIKTDVESTIPDTPPPPPDGEPT